MNGAAHGRSRAVALRAGIVAFFVDQLDIYLPVLVLASIGGYFVPAGTGAGTSELLTDLIFAAALVTRPIGAVVFGHVADRVGRAQATQLATVGFSVVTVLIATAPGSPVDRLCIHRRPHRLARRERVLSRRRLHRLGAISDGVGEAETSRPARRPDPQHVAGRLCDPRARDPVPARSDVVEWDQIGLRAMGVAHSVPVCRRARIRAGHRLPALRSRAGGPGNAGRNRDRRWFNS